MRKPEHVAAEAFARTLTRMKLTRGLGDPEEIGRRAALLVAAEHAWREHLGTLLDLASVRALLGGVSRQAVHDLMKRRRLLAVEEKGERLYPAFQFRQGKALPGVAGVLAAFEAAVLDPHTVAAWLNRPNPELESRSPAEWLHEGRGEDAVVLAARRVAARLEH